MVGIALGVVAVLALVFIVCCCCRRRRKRYAKTPVGQMDTTMPTPATFVSLRDAQLNWSESDLQVNTETPIGGLWEDPVLLAARIARDRIMVQERISKGGFGEVYRGLYEGRAVAIKVLLPALRKDNKQVQSFLGETKILASMDHPRIVRLVGVAWDLPRDLCAVTEMMEGGDLRALLKAFEEPEYKRSTGFDLDKLKIALHIAEALAYLHSLQPIVLHRDLKSRNVLLDGQLNAKLTDFGVAREASESTMTAGVGTSLWMAPEVMLGEKYNQSADVFSFGVLLSELDTHALPYKQAQETASGRRVPDAALLQWVALGRIRVEFSENAPESMKQLALSCVDLNPAKRPTATEIAQLLQRELEI